MARPRTSAPKIYLHRSTGWYCANFSGVRVRLAKTRTDAEKIYDVKLTEWLRAGRPVARERQLRDPNALTVSAAMLAYYQHTETRVCKKQLARVLAAAGAARELFCDKPAAEFDQLDLEKVRDALLRRPSKRNPAKMLSRTYVNYLIGAIQTAWGWLASRKMVPATCALELRTLKALRENEGGAETPPIAAVSATDVAATLPRLSPTLRAMVQVGQLTGMRPGEICAMRRCDLATSATESVGVPIRGGKIIRVSAAKVDDRLVWAYAPPTHKNRWRGKPRLIPIPPAAQTVLAPFLEGRDPQAYLFSPLKASDAWRAAKKRKKKYGKGRQPGQRYTAQSFSKAIRKAARRAGIAEWTAGQLRHAAAQRADELGGRDSAASLLGHANPDVTSTYISDTFQKAARASLAGQD
jgi:integrase